MKANWSKILIIAMLTFMAFIVAMGIKMATSSQSLYEVDYYEKGEDHTARMSLEKEAKRVSFQFLNQSNKLTFDFDSIGYIEEIKLIKLSDSNSDKLLSVQNRSAQKELVISLGDLSKGIWVLEVKGVVNDAPFFIKDQIIK